MREMRRGMHNTGKINIFMADVHGLRRNAELSWARSHLAAMRMALSSARSTSPREGLSTGVFSRRSDTPACQSC